MASCLQAAAAAMILEERRVSLGEGDLMLVGQTVNVLVKTRLDFSAYVAAVTGWNNGAKQGDVLSLAQNLDVSRVSAA